MNAPIYYKWVLSSLLEGSLKNDYTSNLYKKFVKWVEDNKEKPGEVHITQTEFGRMLSGACIVEDNDESMISQGVKYKAHAGMKMIWDFDSLLSGLKMFNLLDPSFSLECAISLNDSSDNETSTTNPKNV